SFIRSPHPHAVLMGIDAAAARELPGVTAVFTGADLAKHCTPWVAVLAHLKGMKSAPQLPLPLERATWVGEAVAAGGAESRAHAEDACAQGSINHAPLPAGGGKEARPGARAP